MRNSVETSDSAFPQYWKAVRRFEQLPIQTLSRIAGTFIGIIAGNAEKAVPPESLRETADIMAELREALS